MGLSRFRQRRNPPRHSAPPQRRPAPAARPVPLQHRQTLGPKRQRLPRRHRSRAPPPARVAPRRSVRFARVPTSAFSLPAALGLKRRPRPRACLFRTGVSGQPQTPSTFPNFCPQAGQAISFARRGRAIYSTRKLLPQMAQSGPRNLRGARRAKAHPSPMLGPFHSPKGPSLKAPSTAAFPKSAPWSPPNTADNLPHHRRQRHPRPHPP